MSTLKLLQSHRYAEVISECRRELSVNPNDMAALGNLAAALRATERYEDALPLYQQIDAYERADTVAHGRPGRQKDIACIYWYLGETSVAINAMRGLVQGIIDRSIEFADAAGGVQQGLLLYYMAVTTQDAEAASFALDYMRDRAKRPAIRSWPGPVARYYLREIDFAEVLNAATGVADVQRAVDIARGKLLSRRRLCVALFHDGVRSRTQGAEDQCLARMRECYDLEDPLLEPEWYLARYEVGRSGEVATAR